MIAAIRSSLFHHNHSLDRYAMGLSGLCAVHCLASAVLVALASTAGGLLLNPLFHEVGLTIAIGLGALALGRGIFQHGYMAPAVTGSFGLGIMAGAMQLPHGNGGETLWTIIGVAILALGHDLNRRAAN
ncbi:MAG: MerC domain-containing protein [Sphingomonas sp.]|uniref:MerC domain-containing protein n=1 Tax=Sphingomonas sp. TaxID=28214 RepID=UPI0012008AC1|nr:MerC domain-containing protein [Sphingomonas sp.]THD37907.1 MAG: MerC domain-containing protein [Sphingomonas sp.]